MRSARLAIVTDIETACGGADLISQPAVLNLLLENPQPPPEDLRAVLEEVEPQLLEMLERGMHDSPSTEREPDDDGEEGDT